MSKKATKSYKYNPNLKSINPEWKGNILFDNRFANGNIKDVGFSFFDILKWKFSKNDFKNGRKDEDYQLKVVHDDSFLISDKDVIVWLGHASFFIRINGVTILTDPILGSLPFIKRMTKFPIDKHKLKNIDYVLLSHAHRDHFDKRSMKILAKNNPNMKVLLPMELGKWFAMKGINFQEAAWYQQYEIPHKAKITLMPAQHWSNHNGYDYNMELWGSFVIEIGDKTIFFAGDSAYGSHFKTINSYFPNIDYAMLPIAAYRPDYIMKQSHMSPWEAMDAFTDLKAKTMIPMHYGTFNLADEYFGEPEEIMRENSDRLNIKILPAGETFEI